MDLGFIAVQNCGNGCSDFFVVPGNLAVDDQTVDIREVQSDPGGEGNGSQDRADPDIRQEDLYDCGDKGQEDYSDAPQGDNAQGGKAIGVNVQAHTEEGGDIDDYGKDGNQGTEDFYGFVLPAQGQRRKNQTQGQQGNQYELEKAAAGICRVAAAHSDAFGAEEEVPNLNIGKETVDDGQGGQDQAKG